MSLGRSFCCKIMWSFEIPNWISKWGCLKSDIVKKDLAHPLFAGKECELWAKKMTWISLSMATTLADFLLCFFPICSVVEIFQQIELQSQLMTFADWWENRDWVETAGFPAPLPGLDFDFASKQALENSELETRIPRPCLCNVSLKKHYKTLCATKDKNSKLAYPRLWICISLCAAKHKNSKLAYPRLWNCISKEDLENSKCSIPSMYLSQTLTLHQNNQNPKFDFENSSFSLQFFHMATECTNYKARPRLSGQDILKTAVRCKLSELTPSAWWEIVIIMLAGECTNCPPSK